MGEKVNFDMLVVRWGWRWESEEPYVKDWRENKFVLLGGC